MGVYTKTGDKGTTGLLTGERVAKDSVRVEAYGNVDELNSVLGLARAWCEKAEVRDELLGLQKLLMLLMAELASAATKDSIYITAEHVRQLEQIIDRFEQQLPPLTSFLIPGGSKGGAFLDLARTTARRAERQSWRLAKEESVGEPVLIALNRLSDLCFVLMRFEEQNAK